MSTLPTKPYEEIKTELDVPCTACNSAPDVPCVDREGKEAQKTHKVRTRLFQGIEDLRPPTSWPMRNRDRKHYIAADQIFNDILDKATVSPHKPGVEVPPSQHEEKPKPTPTPTGVGAGISSHGALGATADLLRSQPKTLMENDVLSRVITNMRPVYTLVHEQEITSGEMLDLLTNNREELFALTRMITELEIMELQMEAHKALWEEQLGLIKQQFALLFKPHEVGSGELTK